MKDEQSARTRSKDEFGCMASSVRFRSRDLHFGPHPRREARRGKPGGNECTGRRTAAGNCHRRTGRYSRCHSDVLHRAYGTPNGGFAKRGPGGFHRSNSYKPLGGAAARSLCKRSQRASNPRRPLLISHSRRRRSQHSNFQRQQQTARTCLVPHPNACAGRTRH
jgi:hypothetical protein